MKDKLIELILQCDEENDVLSCYHERPRLKQAAEILADYILEDSWIRPPIKLNQILYKPYTHRNMIDECRVSSITQKSDGTFKIRLTNLYYRAVFEVTEEDFNKSVFLTKEGAEQALKGGKQE